MNFSVGISDNKYAVKLLRILSLLIIFTFLILPLSAQTKKRGKVTAEYANGNKESSGKVKNYKKQGVWKYWSESGVLTKTITWKDDVKEGLHTEFYADGKKSLEGNYSGNRKKGTWNSWYSDGKLSSKLNYDTDYFTKTGDVYVGLQQWWYENGQLREQSNYEGGKIISRQTWYKNGKKRAIENYKNGLREGAWRKYPEPSESTDTLPSTITNYVNGKKEGVQLGYMRGRLSEEIYYKEDQLHGTFKKWDSNSLLGISENYVNGKRDGLCKYFNYGKCIREVTYENGRINGEEKEYDGRGELFRISWYKKGTIDSSYNYHKNGKLAISRTYKYYPGLRRTEEFSDYTEWDSLGVLLLRGTYHFEMKDKDWTTYYANGKVKSVTPWKAGKISGVYTKWYANGKKMIEIECDGHYISTSPKVWNEKGNAIKPGTKAYNEIVDSNKPGEIYNDPKRYKENRTEIETPHDVEDVRIGDMTQDGDEGESMIITPTVDRAIEERPEEVFSFAEEMPKFNGDMQKFLNDNLKYPEEYKEANKQGTVYVRFVVEKDGSVTNIQIAKGIPGSPLFDKEAIRVVSIMPKWEPAKMNGRAVKISQTIPIRFKLQ